jgi:AmmeMemoRadiSam system protein B
MQKRKPIVAGQFYPAQPDSCVAEINACLEAVKPITGELVESSGSLSTSGRPSRDGPETIVAGIVPHAGWTFSGHLAALVFSAIKQQHERVNTFVIFGATHGYFGRLPAVYDAGSWVTPLGEVFIDQELADAVLETGSAVSDPDAHDSEHSIEVQAPFIQYLFPGAKILPVLTPSRTESVALGTIVGDIIKADEHKKIVCIGSTDLTHYGPRYDFTPMGTGKQALQWASGVNDKKFIDLALKCRPQDLLVSAVENCNACGPGAAAAAVAAAKKLGSKQGLLLAYTNSNEVMLQKMGQTSADSVGYAAIVF